MIWKCKWSSPYRKREAERSAYVGNDAISPVLLQINSGDNMEKELEAGKCGGWEVNLSS
jgi:hypothetical protein